MFSTISTAMRRVAPLALLIASSSFGYIRFNTGETPPVNLQRVDNTGIQFYINSGVVAGATSSASGKAVTVISAHSDPLAAARAALTSWNSVATANVTFLPLMTTATGHANDGMMVIVIASSTDDVSAVGGALAITSIISASSSGTDPDNPNLTVQDGSIIDTDVLLNPGKTFSTDGSMNPDGSATFDLQAVLTHELGHSLGANHTGVLGATMFQFNTVSQRFLSSDDLAFVNSSYPATSNPAAFGTISGTVNASGGPTPYALLTFIDSAQGLTLGGLADATGKYSVQVPPGNYLVYAEPFNQIVQPGNLYFTTPQAALVTTFQPTLGPTSLAVTANNTATANIAVTGGTSALVLPSYGFGAAGGNNDLKSLSSIDGPIPIASGQSLDIAFAGTGFVASLSTSNIQVYGAGITVTGVHKDLATAGAFPIIRATLNIPTQTKSALATIFVTSAGSTLAMTGVLVVGPPTPATVPADAVSAASNIVGNGTVSPGEYVTLYGTAVAPSTGPFAGIGYSNTGYVMGFLPTNLGGVSVTFDGVPAPIFYDGQGYQINLQVPFEVAGKTSTQVVVSYFGSASAPITLPVVPMHPALFTYSIPTTTPTTAFAFNVASDGSATINTSVNPAALGQLMIVVGTGIGLPAYQAPATANPILTGAPAPAPPASNLTANGWTGKIGGIDATVSYAAWLASQTAEAEWFVYVPASLTAAGAVPIQFTSATGATTQSNLTVYVKANTPVVTLSSFSLSNSAGTGGNTIAGTVNLSAPAPNGGANVILSSNSAAVTVPASVTVGAGATTAAFAITTSSVTSSQTATITATYGGTSLSATYVVGPLTSQVSPWTAFTAYNLNGNLTIDGQTAPVLIQNVNVGGFIGTLQSQSNSTVLSLIVLFNKGAAVSGNSLVFTGADSSSFYANSSRSALPELVVSATMSLNLNAATVGSAVNGTVALTTTARTLSGTFTGSVQALQ